MVTMFSAPFKDTKMQQGFCVAVSCAFHSLKKGGGGNKFNSYLWF